MKVIKMSSLLSVTRLRRLNINRFSFDLDIFHATEYVFSVLLWYLNKCIIVIHIDGTYQLTRNLCLTGNRTKNISRTDSLAFSNINKQAHHAFFGSGVTRQCIFDIPILFGKFHSTDRLFQKCSCNVHSCIIAVVDLTLDEIDHII